MMTESSFFQVKRAPMYLLTKNLLCVIGVHALLNGAPMIMSSDHYAISAIICLILFVCIHPIFLRSKLWK